MKKSALNSLIFSSVVLLSAPIILPASVFADEKNEVAKEQRNEDTEKPEEPDVVDPEPEPEPEPEPDPEPKPDPKPPVSSSKPSSSSSKPTTSSSKPSPAKPDETPAGDSGKGGGGGGNNSDGDSSNSNSSDVIEDDLSKNEEKKLDEANEKLEKERAKYQDHIDEFDRNKSSATARVLINDINEINKLIKKTAVNYEKSASDVDMQINKNKLLTYVNLAAQIYYTRDSPNQAVKQSRNALQMSFTAAALKSEITDEIKSAEKKYKIKDEDSILVELGIEDEIKSSNLGTVESQESNSLVIALNAIAAVAIVGYIIYSNRAKE